MNTNPLINPQTNRSTNPMTTMTTKPMTTNPDTMIPLVPIIPMMTNPTQTQDSGTAAKPESMKANFSAPDEPMSVRNDFFHPDFGYFRTMTIDETSWASLDDVGRFAGVNISSIIGRDEPESALEDQEGNFEPGELCCLREYGIPDYGIHIKALLRIFRKARGGDKLVTFLLLDVIPQLRGCRQAPAHACPPKAVQHVFYDPSWGEFRAIKHSRRVWLLASNIARYMGLTEDDVTSLAWHDNTIGLSSDMFINSVEANRLETYISWKVSQKIISAFDHHGVLVCALKAWIRDEFTSRTKINASR